MASSYADVELVPIHGGSLRLFIAHAGQPQSARVVELLAKEKSEGLLAFEHYRDFGDRVARLKEQLLALLQRLQGEGRRIAAYGASAKGSTLMNAFGIDARLIEFVVDRSSLKQGRFTPGNHLPILPPEALLERRPDYVLLLTWNFSDEILAQQSEFRAARRQVHRPGSRGDGEVSAQRCSIQARTVSPGALLIWACARWCRCCPA